MQSSIDHTTKANFIWQNRMVLGFRGAPVRRLYRLLTLSIKRVITGTVKGAARNLKAIKPVNHLVSEAFRLWYEMPVSPTHYYSPLPDTSLAKKNLRRWYREDSLAGVPIELDKQRRFLESLEVYGAECDSLPDFGRVTAEGYGQGYGEVEAHLLHCIIRKIKPRRIVEVGSGVSTYFALNALQMNEGIDKVNATMICVEPYPLPRLQELAAQNRITLHAKDVQDVETSFFRDLEDGDILFVDSSHVSKVDSDINFLYLGVLANLKKGVIIHIHDICFPYLTCPPEHPMFDCSLLWNETALVQAFLAWNSVFEILLCESYLHYKHPETIKKVVNIYDNRRHFPSSLWLVKTG
jgi:predicted O-methyltransferase YrrM